MPTVNPAMRSPVSQPTSDDVCIDKLLPGSQRGTSELTVTGDPVKNGEKSPDIIESLFRVNRRNRHVEGDY